MWPSYFIRAVSRLEVSGPPNDVETPICGPEVKSGEIHRMTGRPDDGIMHPASRTLRRGVPLRTGFPAELVQSQDAISQSLTMLLYHRDVRVHAGHRLRRESVLRYRSDYTSFSCLATT